MADLIAALAATAGGVAVESDDDFANTVLLLHGDGTDGTQNNTFLDSSTNNFTITRNGNCSMGSYSPFSKPDGRWGNYFDGSSSTLQVPSNTAFNVGTGDFTLEFWINRINNNFGVFKLYNSSTSNGPQVEGSNYASWHKDGVGSILTSTTALSVGEFYHIAYCRSGTTFRLFVNGVQEASVTNSDSFDFSSWIIGRGYYGNVFNGYLSNFRLLKAVALYTSGFTPSTSPLTAISGTSLLTCQSNRFVDNSANNFALTPYVSAPKVTPFSPFPITTEYSPSVNGGSAYLDGSGDFLTVGTTINWSTFGSYTLEFWAYHVTLATNVWYLVSDDFSAGETGWYVYSDGSIAVGINTVNQIVSSAGAVKAGQWQHIAYTYDGTTTKIYVNGVEVASDTTAVYANVSATISTGTGGGNTLVGYLSGMRIVNSVVYSSAFTPPIAPPTAISGTHALLNFTNAGIYDNTGFNVLETVGNAQIDTTTKKYGTGSMEFDGTGDWLKVPNSPDLQLGTGNFTIEFWVYLASGDTGSARGLVAKGGASTGWLVSLDSSEKVVFTYTTSTITSSGAITTNAWNHIAVVREGTGSNETKIYIGGTNDGTGTVSTDFNQTEVMYIGANRAAGDPMKGFIDDLRITKGVARYTTTFTPPTKAFPNIGA